MNTNRSEQSLENETLQRFAALGWQTANAFYEAYSPADAKPDRPYLGRSNDSDVLLRDRVLAALEKLNPALPPAAIQSAWGELSQGRSAMLPVQANRATYALLKNGIPVTYRDADGEELTAKAQIIDWRTPANNDFLMVQQLWVQGQPERKRADLVGFVNGIPLLFGELKASHRRLSDAYKDNLTKYKAAIPHLFWYTGLMVLSNGSQAALGNLSAPFKHFSTWKKVQSESEQGVIALDTLIRAVCTPPRLLDMLENYTLYHEGAKGLEKITAKNHQYLGVENALEAVDQGSANDGKLGVFWHTQGSGKSFSMIMFGQKLLRTRGGHFTFVIITDRTSLDDQIYKNFARSGAVTEGERRVRAQSGSHLKRLLREDHRYVFTLIHKFHSRDNERYPVLSERDDIIVITDEAHRSQYSELAMNMRLALPNASFIGFTGTPLMADEVQLTREVFGNYVSVYNFRQSVEDGATVPLYYENRVPELQLTNEQLNDDMDYILEQADVDDDDEAQLLRRFANVYQLITRDERLDRIAADIVKHFIYRGHRGKAMVISIDKLTTVRMYAKVQLHWQRTMAGLRAQLRTASPAKHAELDDLLAYMQSTDMAVVVSPSQDENELMAQHGLDMRQHRDKMTSQDLDERFKDVEDPFRLAFVCAKWRTGFDAPSCSTLYLDRPMRNHTLMQTIARANRVYGDKHNGLIVDYIGIFSELQQALAIYASGPTGAEDDFPIEAKTALVEELRTAMQDVDDFCTSRGVDLDAMVTGTKSYDYIAQDNDILTRLVELEDSGALDDAVDAMVVDDKLMTHFVNLVNRVRVLYKAILPDVSAADFTARVRLLALLVTKIHNMLPDDTNTVPDVAYEVAGLLDHSIGTRRYVIADREESVVYDLAKIDFDALQARFEQGRKHNEAATLRGKINARIRHLERLNRSRTDYRKTFEALIADYNENSKNIEQFFEQLLKLAQDLQVEEQRHVRENLSEAELAIFDILTRPAPELSPTEIKQVKQVARDLLSTLEREKLVLDWQKRQRDRAAVRITIEDTLYAGLPERYDADLCDQKRDDLYQHIFDAYLDRDHNVYI